MLLTALLLVLVTSSVIVFRLGRQPGGLPMTARGYLAWPAYLARRPRVYAGVELVEQPGVRNPRVDDVWYVSEGDAVTLEVTVTGTSVWPVAALNGTDLPGSCWVQVHDGVVSVWQIHLPLLRPGPAGVVVWLVPAWGAATSVTFDLFVVAVPVLALSADVMPRHPLLAFRLRVSGDVQRAGPYILALVFRTVDGARLEWNCRVDLTPGPWTAVFTANRSEALFAGRGDLTFEEALICSPDTATESRFGSPGPLPLQVPEADAAELSPVPSSEPVSPSAQDAGEAPLHGPVEDDLQAWPRQDLEPSPDAGLDADAHDPASE